jgi:hypothetical protein
MLRQHAAWCPSCDLRAPGCLCRRWSAHGWPIPRRMEQPCSSQRRAPSQQARPQQPRTMRMTRIRSRQGDWYRCLARSRHLLLPPPLPVGIVAPKAHRAGPSTHRRPRLRRCWRAWTPCASGLACTSAAQAAAACTTSSTRCWTMRWMRCRQVRGGGGGGGGGTGCGGGGGGTGGGGGGAEAGPAAAVAEAGPAAAGGGGGSSNCLLAG